MQCTHKSPPRIPDPQSVRRVTELRPSFPRKHDAPPIPCTLIAVPTSEYPIVQRPIVRLSHYDGSGSLVILARPRPVSVAGALVPARPEAGGAKASRIRGAAEARVKILGIHSPVFRPGYASDGGLMIHHIR
jgi:hypothetical protein